MDYLLFHSKGIDKIEQTQLTHEYFTERDYYFNSIGKRMRGYRKNRNPKKRTLYYGISIYDIPELKAPKKSVPWRNWGRDSCIVEQNKNFYGKSVYQLSIPLRCSVSGTTNLALWPIYTYGLKLNEDDLKYFILAVWATLSLDTGHTLQEVLSSVKISAIYLKELIKYNDKNYINIKNSMPKNTLRNMVKVVQNIRPLGNSDETVDRNRMMKIRNKIYAYNSSNSRMYTEIFNENPDYEKDKKEMKDRSDLEYYFNNYDLLKSNRSKFGAYYDGFFRKISDDNFIEIRKKSQEQLKKYFKRDCLQQ